MKKSQLQKYAKLIARKGVNVQKGQDVRVRACPDQLDFVRMVVEECYKAGAGKVTVEWEYNPVTKATYKYCKLDTLSRTEKWEEEKYKHFVETRPARIFIESDDPDALKGVNQEKVAKAQQARAMAFKPYRDQLDNHYQWCIAAVPGVEWAKKVFPNDTKNKAVEKLWQAILFTSRADGENPVEAWNEHNKDIKERCDYLNSLKIKELKYKSSNGTDFRVGLIDGCNFLGGKEDTLEGIEYNPNIPSEEVFTSPMRGNADGTVVATRPLSYRGELIENFSVTFKDGKVVDVSAEKNEDLLRSMISMDEGAAYLGECALVPYDSPIRNSGITFYNTLFDENACCHLALGRGFNECLEGYANLSFDECKEKGINDSLIHVDFMIGSEDLEIKAVTRDGKTVKIFEKGNWAF